ncbi:MAG TPA: DUF692 domain-containing protein [Ktedonobacteraceae bacterium]
MQQSINRVKEIPYLGSGLGYRRELKQEILAAREKIDFLEVLTDQFQPAWMIEELEQLCDVFPVIPHGIGLSVGSMIPLDKDYLRAIKRISDITGSPFYSEHLCVTRAPGIDIGHLSPLWFTEETLENTVSNVSSIQDYLGKPLILENVTYTFDIPGGSISQTEFFNRLVDATNCGVLLDVTNVYINSVNHKFDPLAFIEQMPLESVVQIHLAGGYWSQGILVDGHSEPVQEESWKLLEALAARCKVRGAILEHDDNFPEWTIMLEQIGRARQIIHAHIPSEASSGTR